MHGCGLPPRLHWNSGFETERFFVVLFAYVLSDFLTNISVFDVSKNQSNLGNTIYHFPIPPLLESLQAQVLGLWLNLVRGLKLGGACSSFGSTHGISLVGSFTRDHLMEGMICAPDRPFIS